MEVFSTIIIFASVSAGLIWLIYEAIICWKEPGIGYKREAERLRKMKENDEEEYNSYIQRNKNYYKSILGIDKKTKGNKNDIS